MNNNAEHLLLREIRAVGNSIRNDLATKAAHPTYGITKARLWAQLHRLEGLVIAHRIMADPDCPPNPGALVDPYARTLNVDLNDLSMRIKAA